MHHSISGSRGAVLNPILIGVVLVLAGVSGCVFPPSPPSWPNNHPPHHYVGSAYYGVETEEGARRNAVADAISSLLVLKVGVATVSSEVRQEVESQVHDSSETVRATATISTSATIEGQDIPVNIRIIEYWQDHEKRIIHVLVQDLNP